MFGCIKAAIEIDIVIQTIKFTLFDETNHKQRHRPANREQASSESCRKEPFPPCQRIQSILFVFIRISTRMIAVKCLPHRKIGVLYNFSRFKTSDDLNASKEYSSIIQYYQPFKDWLI